MRDGDGDVEGGPTLTFSPCCAMGFDGEGFVYRATVEPDPDGPTGLAVTRWRVVCQGCGGRIPARIVAGTTG